MRGTDRHYTMSYFNEFSAPRDTLSDYRQGETDGEMNLPLSNQTTFSSYEMEVIAQAQAAISQARTMVEAGQDVIAKNYAAQQHNRYERYNSELKDLSARRDRDEEGMRQRVGPASELQMTLQQHMWNAENSYDDMVRELDREPRLHMHDKLIWRFSYYVVLLGVLAGLEIPINERVFQDLLNIENSFILVIVTGAFGVFIVLLAHFLGLFSVQAGWPRRGREVAESKTAFNRHRRQVRDYVQVFVGIPLILALALAAMYVLAVLRQMSLDGDDIQIVGNLFGAAAKPAVDAAAALGPKALRASGALPPLSANGGMLLLINLGIFLAGTLLSYTRHDPHPDFETRLRARDKARAVFHELQVEFQRQLAENAAYYDRKRVNLVARADQIAEELRRLKVNYKGVERRTIQEVETVVNVVKQRLAAYQSGNCNTRRDPPPAYFGQDSMTRVEALLRSDVAVPEREEEAGAPGKGNGTFASYSAAIN